MSDLSPAAQAVMVAATNGNPNVINDPVYRQCIAAAIRTAADQVSHDWDGFECVDYLMALATELKGSSGTNTSVDPLEPNDLSHLSDEEFLALSPQGFHAP